MAPANPGGGWDQLARLIQLVLIEEEMLPVSLQVINRGGAGGTIGLAELAVRSRNDEHMIMIAGSVMVGAVVAHNSPFGLEDTTPIARLTGEYLAVAVPPDSPYATDHRSDARVLREHPTRSRGAEGPQAVPIIRSSRCLAARRVCRSRAFGTSRSPAVGEAATAVMGSQLTAMVTGYGEIQHLARAGKVRLLATTAPDQFTPNAPPSLTSAGVDIVVSNWRGVVAPPGASPEATAWMVDAFRQMRETKAWQDILERNDWEDSFLVGDALRTFIDDERTRAEAILSELEFGSGGAGYAAVGAWTFPTLILSAFCCRPFWFVRGRAVPWRDGGRELGWPEAVSGRELPSRWGCCSCSPWTMNLLGYHLAAMVLLVGIGRVFGGQRPGQRAHRSLPSSRSSPSCCSTTCLASVCPRAHFRAGPDDDLLGTSGTASAMRCTLANLAAGFAGVLLGTVVGVLPGLGPSIAISLLLPVTFGLDPTTAFVMFGGIYYGSMYGGAITAILINTPGDASAAVTTIDGYQMARAGRAGPLWRRR